MLIKYEPQGSFKFKLLIDRSRISTSISNNQSKPKLPCLLFPSGSALLSRISTSNTSNQTKSKLLLISRRLYVSWGAETCRCHSTTMKAAAGTASWRRCSASAAAGIARARTATSCRPRPTPCVCDQDAPANTSHFTITLFYTHSVGRNSFKGPRAEKP